MRVGATRPQTVIPGDFWDGFMSPDGRYLAGHEPMEVYDASTGERVTPDYRAGQGNRVPLAMTFTDDGGVSFALISPSRPSTNIVTCSLPKGSCETQAENLRGGVFFANQRHQ